MHRVQHDPGLQNLGRPHEDELRRHRPSGGVGGEAALGTRDREAMIPGPDAHDDVECAISMSRSDSRMPFPEILSVLSAAVRGARHGVRRSPGRRRARSDKREDGEPCVGKAAGGSRHGRCSKQVALVVVVVMVVVVRGADPEAE